MVGKWNFLLIGAIVMAQSAPAIGKTTEKPTARDRAELKKLLQTHTYYGGGIPYGVRLATGDPNIPIIDRRSYGTNSSQCGFITARNKRTMLCQ